MTIKYFSSLFTTIDTNIDSVDVKLGSKNMKYYKELGYNGNFGDVIHVKVDDIKPSTFPTTIKTAISQMINGTISNIIIANNFNYLHNCFWIVRCIMRNRCLDCGWESAIRDLKQCLECGSENIDTIERILRELIHDMEIQLQLYV